MRRAVRETGLIAPLACLVAEPVGGERATELRDEEREIANRAFIDDLFQCGQHWNVQRDRLPLLVLRLREVQPAIAHVLPPETHDVRSALTSVDEERQR
jgi:hypothetical protein